jgi:hypothetical protein
MAIPLRAGYFSTLPSLAALPENQLAFLALRHVFRRTVRFGGRVPRKISNARFRDAIFKLCNVWI